MAAGYIPFDLQIEIIKRVSDVKSLIRFRSVSKPWKSLISSSQFIADYHMIHHTDQSNNHHHLLVSYADPIHSNKKYVSIVDDHDDDHFAELRFSLTVPESLKSKSTRIAGSSQGLFLLLSHNPDSGSIKTAALWNPSIRKFVTIDVPVPDVLLDYHYSSVVGFGVCPRTSDSMLVKISYIRHGWEYDDRISSLPWQAEIFTLKSRAWRSPSGSNLPRNTSQLVYDEQVVTYEFIYWLACDRVEMYPLIISFNLTTEEFEERHLSRSLAVNKSYRLSISKLRESLVVLERLYLANKQFYGVWRMDHGVPKSFTKLYTISTPESSINRVLGFRKTGEAIIVMKGDNFEQGALFFYEPYSKHIDPIGIYGKHNSFFASSYMETLLLLDQ